VSVVRPVAGVARFAARVVDPGVIDGVANGAATAVAVLGGMWRRAQTGNLQHYALSLLAGAAVLLVYYVVR
jgi:NADH-quinone oxidoreductase subunit L